MATRCISYKRQSGLGEQCHKVSAGPSTVSIGTATVVMVIRRRLSFHSAETASPQSVGVEVWVGEVDGAAGERCDLTGRQQSHSEKTRQPEEAVYQIETIERSVERFVERSVERSIEEIGRNGICMKCKRNGTLPSKHNSLVSPWYIKAHPVQQSASLPGESSDARYFVKRECRPAPAPHRNRPRLVWPAAQQYTKRLF